MSNVVYRGPILGNCSNFDDSLSLWLFTSLTKDTDLTGVDSTKIEDNEYQLSFEALILVFLVFYRIGINWSNVSTVDK
jgi:hypothetical protein